MRLRQSGEKDLRSKDRREKRRATYACCSRGECRLCEWDARRMGMSHSSLHQRHAPIHATITCVTNILRLSIISALQKVFPVRNPRKVDICFCELTLKKADLIHRSTARSPASRGGLVTWPEANVSSKSSSARESVIPCALCTCRTLKIIHEVEETSIIHEKGPVFRRKDHYRN